MAILQALISLIGKSAGKILNAIFGWAVVALFGRSSPKEQIVLSGLVGAAAAWPLLLLGIAFPKLTTFLVAFVPLSQHVPSSVVRLIWLALALLVPLAVGIVVASKAPPGSPSEPFVVRALRGFPVTLGIACAFLLMFVTVPVLRLTSIARGRQDEHVPCITDGEEYEEVARQIDWILRVHELHATRSEPSWWLAGPSKVLAKLGGKALRGFAPTHLAYWDGPDLEVAFYPSDILVRGTKSKTAWTHGLIAEAISRGPGLQTFDPDTQDIEREIQQVWRVYAENPAAHVRSKNLLARASEIARDLGRLHADYEAWQILYRETAQLERALNGQPQLLQALLPTTEVSMEPPANEVEHPDHPLAGSSTAELMGKLAAQSAALVEKQIALAKAEVKDDLRSEIKAAEGFGIAGVCALTVLNLLLVAVVLALSAAISGWLAALIVAGVMLLVAAIAALVGRGKLVTKPLAKSRRILEEDAHWVKERIS